MSIYSNLEAMTEVAMYKAKEHNCNYNVIISNHVDGDFVPGRSTYEMVADSFFNRERPNVVLLFKTDDRNEIESIAPAKSSHKVLITGSTFDLKLSALTLKKEAKKQMPEVYMAAIELPRTATATISLPYKNTSRKHKRRFY
jgi:hypothetical protein